jgi:hypothetical protein
VYGSTADTSFEEMSFASFVEKYEAVEKMPAIQTNANCWKRADGNGYIKLRTKAHVVRGTPWIKPDAANPNFCFAELFLHKPWRTIRDLPGNDDDCVAAFAREQEVSIMTELQQESSSLISRQRGLDALKADESSRAITMLPPSEYVFVEADDHGSDEEVACGNEATDTDKCSSDKHGDEWVSKHAYGLDAIQRARVFMKEVVRPSIQLQRRATRTRNGINCINVLKSRYVYPIARTDNSEDACESMDGSQWIPFALAMCQARQRFRSSIENTPCAPLHMIIHGEGGSGKSWLIRHIVKDIHCVFGEHTASRRNSKRILLLAHQGTAAFNIKGRTICSALELTSFSRNAFSASYAPLSTLKGGQTKLKRLQEEFADVHLVVIDEFSVISCGMLYWIDQRMREIWPRCSHLAFGGRDVIFTGDRAQLDPVVPFALSTALSKITNPIQRRGRELWESISNVCTLTTQNRGKSDPEWFAALRRLRCNCSTEDDVALFNSRYRKSNEMPAWAPAAKHIAYTNADVNETNARSLEATSSSTVHIRSKHKVQLKRLAKKREIISRSIELLIRDAETPDASRDRVVGTFVKLAVGAPVVLTFNVEQYTGLCNGTNGVIYDFIFPSDDELPIILVQIIDTYLGPSFLPDVANIIPVIPRRTTWSKTTSDLSVSRDGIPLRLAYAMTVHKMQGLTCSKIVFHANSIQNASFVYVALSRVRHRNDIVLTTPLTLAKLTSSSSVRTAFNEEEQRIENAVANTRVAALAVIAEMKQLALVHNQMLQPRS